MMLKRYSGLPLLVILSCLASACKNPSPDSQSKAQKSAPSSPLQTLFLLEVLDQVPAQ